MSDIAALLDVQELDLEADALRKRRVELPERAQRSACDEQVAKLGGAREEIDARGAEISKAERALAAEVAAVVAKARSAEETLYSGTVTAPKELESLSEELRIHKEKQDELEEQEIELLERIEGVEAELAANDAQRLETEARARDLDAEIARIEAEIDAEIVEVDGRRDQAGVGLPAAVLEAYARRREQPKMVGRAAARLVARSCEGCRVDMPVLECSRIRAEPWDAVVHCVHCGRMLVR